MIGVGVGAADLFLLLLLEILLELLLFVGGDSVNADLLRRNSTLAKSDENVLLFVLVVVVVVVAVAVILRLFLDVSSGGDMAAAD